MKALDYIFIKWYEQINYIAIIVNCTIHTSEEIKLSYQTVSLSNMGL
jgi:hypothetical protein